MTNVSTIITWLTTVETRADEFADVIDPDRLFDSLASQHLDGVRHAAQNARLYLEGARKRNCLPSALNPN